MGIARYEKRVAAYLFDEILAILVGVGLLIILLYFGAMDDSWFLNGVVSMCFAYCIYVIFYFFIALLSGGSSLGGLIFGLRAVHEDGKRFSFSDALVRAAIGGVLVAMAFEAIYMLYVHSELSPIDRMTDTKVIDIRRR